MSEDLSLILGFWGGQGGGEGNRLGGLRLILNQIHHRLRFQRLSRHVNLIQKVGDWRQY
ncbi:hypothetical protein AGABI1DRAFT_115348 [Agaricus bisporus var. burnettii JB137-S8]|uniref:Uncharacterized protein n=1 Tax=Agaricus bisporus var. burnettii (strain JB137-S8 / ATCC MYA-4627 / FGSC 10392) TaxID=597362 RepID=K5X2K1_AGABU|nr:uncharacterized protein AGABI1DRAFT_115348 [Agaricus bisporus var. burnettii JB137-S8]EKM77117.1 hypothetical protein AGABI1DRAFT_115348 [Agaricus bisporus var. burnettii JB137-S8]